jgi:uncharacterized protein (TIGR03792 family)
MVIEELHFLVDPAEQKAFLAKETEVWTGFLRTCDGFVDKQVWIAEDEPSRIVVIIWWETMEQWKRITAAECDEVDKRMGEWLRPIAFARALNVVKPSIAAQLSQP